MPGQSSTIASVPTKIRASSSRPKLHAAISAERRRSRIRRKVHRVSFEQASRGNSLLCEGIPNDDVPGSSSMRTAGCASLLNESRVSSPTNYLRKVRNGSDVSGKDRLAIIATCGTALKWGTRRNNSSLSRYFFAE